MAQPDFFIQFIFIYYLILLVAASCRNELLLRSLPTRRKSWEGKGTLSGERFFLFFHSPHLPFSKDFRVYRIPVQRYCRNRQESPCWSVPHGLSHSRKWMICVVDGRRRTGPLAGNSKRLFPARYSSTRTPLLAIATIKSRREKIMPILWRIGVVLRAMTVQMTEGMNNAANNAATNRSAP